ncbi:ATP-grasp domain-containing protein [Paenibacillus cellulosilyticus]|uniref:ATP-grasp domain-containing protein n=1 Tax=Paenibacillus cellulosilyticus TaxID=375489 RepID=A0A2V2YV12_9BACL|nr:ATP-grasp domain-containing protein [Paenibacillus cellulosilyticus]PWW02862.1 ATP-grasp domain-containing protein [Paenibacillus cellulosilyticus]
MNTLVYLSDYPHCFEPLLNYRDIHKVLIVEEGTTTEQQHLYFDEIHTVSSMLRLDEFEAIFTNLASLGTIQAIIVPDEDYVAIGGYLRSKFNIPGLNEQQTRNVRDKFVMKELVRAAGINGCYSVSIQDPDELPEHIVHIGYPVIVKPVDGAGTAHTYRLNSQADLDNYLQSYRKQWRQIVVEPFIEGKEFHCDSIIVDGEVVFSSVGEYLFNCLDVVNKKGPLGMIIYPASADSIPHIRAIKEMNTQVVKTLGITKSVCHSEMFLQPSGKLYFGEIGARVGGGQIIPPCVRNSYGFDLLQTLVDLEMGQWKLELQEKPGVYTGVICFPSRQGIVRNISKPDDFRDFPGIIQARIFNKPGDQLNDMTNTMTRTGLAVAEGDCLEQVRERLMNVYSAFVLEVEHETLINL